MRDVLPHPRSARRARWVMLLSLASVAGLLTQASAVLTHPMSAAAWSATNPPTVADVHPQLGVRLQSTPGARLGHLLPPVRPATTTVRPRETPSPTAAISSAQTALPAAAAPTPAPTPSPTHTAASVPPVGPKVSTSASVVSPRPAIAPAVARGGGGAAPAGPTAVAKVAAAVAVRRLFASTSPWNTAKTGVTYAASADGVLHSQTYGLNNGAYDHPTYFAKASDPVTSFHLGAGWGFPATTLTVPAPAGMAPSAGGDHVMTMLLADGRILDLYGVTGSGTNVTASFYGVSDGINGTGFGNPATSAAIGTTAIGSTQAGGTILARDVAAGAIPHALCIAFDYSALGGVGNGGVSVLPAVANDDGGGPGPLAEGSLLLIPAGTPRPAGLSPMGAALWTAAATYGVYITDQLSGDPMFYGDGSRSVATAFTSNDLTSVGRALQLVKTW